VSSNSKPELSLFLDILHKFEALNIPYVIIGGFAAVMYGITRATYDIDIIVDMDENHMQALSAAYPLPRYYADPYQMQNAMKIGSSFNIIDTDRGEKADIFPLTMDSRYQPAFDNRIRRDVDMVGTDPFPVWTARREDVIIGKLMAWDEGRSERHTADIFEILLFYHLGGYVREYPFDEPYVDAFVSQLGNDTVDIWQLIKEAAREEASRNR